MSRIGPTLQPAVLRTSRASAAIPLEARALLRSLPSPAVEAIALAADSVVCGVAPILAAILLPAPASGTMSRLAALLLVLLLGLGIAKRIYRHSLLFCFGKQVVGVLQVGGAALAMLALAVGLLGRLDDIPPLWAATSAVLLLVGLVLARLSLASFLCGIVGQRFAPRVVVIGDGSTTGHVLRLLRQNADRSFRIIGVVHDHADIAEGLIEGIPLLGPVTRLNGLIRRGLVDEVIIALPSSEQRRILELAEMLGDYPVHIFLTTDLANCHVPGSKIIEKNGLIMLRLAEKPLSGWRSVVKRAEDLLIAGIALFLCAIPMAVIAVAIRLDSPGPILFRQKRIGLNNRKFEMFKFRTMYHHMAEYSCCRQTTRNDPRVTRVGAILRRTSLDELPQIFNVLRGEMSVVGPRPHAPGTLAGSRPFEQVVHRYAARHRVKPGLTGLAQVRGLRGETRTEDMLIRRVESDLEYIASWSPWLDMFILLRTLIIVLRMQNAY